MCSPILSGNLLNTDCESPGLSFGSPKSPTYERKTLKYILLTYCGLFWASSGEGAILVYLTDYGVESAEPFFYQPFFRVEKIKLIKSP